MDKKEEKITLLEILKARRIIRKTMPCFNCYRKDRYTNYIRCGNYSDCLHVQYLTYRVSYSKFIELL